MRQIFIIFLLATLFGASSLVSLGNADFPLDPSILRLRYVLIGTSSVFFLLMSRFDLSVFQKGKAVAFLLIWFLLTLVIVISGLTNNDSVLVRDGFWMMTGIPIIFFGAIPKLIKKNPFKTIALALLLGHIPYIVTSLLFHPITPSLYSGVLANSNQMGNICATIATGLFILLIAGLSEKTSVLYISCIILLLVGDLILILVANSRTSLIAFIIMLLVSFYNLCLQIKYLLKSVCVMITISIINLVFFSQQIYTLSQEIEQSILAKDTTSGRTEIWGETIKNMRVFGYGSEYFERSFGIGGHNTIIDILGQNGIIAAYLLICLLAASFSYAYSYFRTYKNEDYYAVAPLFITACFWILAMGESMFGSLGTAMTLAYLLSMGAVVNRSDVKKVQSYRSS